jgi:hypothetical protein
MAISVRLCFPFIRDKIIINSFLLRLINAHYTHRWYACENIFERREVLSIYACAILYLCVFISVNERFIIRIF